MSNASQTTYRGCYAMAARMTALLCILHAAAAMAAGTPQSQSTTTAPASQPSTTFATTGMACPKGAFHRDQSLQAISQDHQPLPTQCEPLAFWPDGSIKWMLVTVLLSSEATQVNLRPALTPLQSSASRPTTQPASPALQIDQTDNGYLVNTGPLRFRVAPDTAGFIGGAVLTTKDDKQIQILRPGPQRLWRLDYYITKELGWSSTDTLLPPGDFDRSRLQINRIDLERSGPLWATFVLRGRYLHDKLGRSYPNRPETPSHVDIRIHAFAGQSYLLVEHTFVYEGNPETDRLAACGLSLPLDLKADKATRITAAAGQDRVERWMYADPLLTPDSADKPASSRTSFHWQQGALVQDSYDHYKTWKLSSPAARPITVDEGQHAPGWIDLSDDTWGCAIGIVGMPENYPTALDASNQDATLTAWLYPPQVPPADLRRYDATSPVSQADAPLGRATGISKTHKLWIYFHTGRDDQANVSRIAQDASRRILLKLSPQQMADSGALGPYLPSDPAAFPELEKLAADVTDFMLAHQQHYHWFGIFDYGDWQGIYRYRDKRNPTDNQRWMNDWNRWGWNNDEGLTSLWLLWQYLRTGDARYFDAGCAMVAHVRDIDINHSQAYPTGPSAGPCEYGDVRGFGHRHGVNHWADGDLSPRVADPIAWRLEYYLTGDGRTRDCIDEVYQANVAQGKAWTYCDSMPTVLYALYAKYEMTADPTYRKKIDAFIDKYCDYALAEDQFPVDTPWDFQADKPKAPFKGRSVDSSFWHSFGMANFLIEWQALTLNDKLRQALIRQAQSALGDNSWDSTYSHLQILSAGYRFTGSKMYLRRMATLLQRNLGAARLVPQDRARWFGPDSYLQPKTISLAGYFMAGLPYLEAAAGNENTLWSVSSATHRDGDR